MPERLDEMLVERDGSRDLSRVIVWRDGAVLGGGGGDPIGGGNGQAMAAEPILVPAGINANPGDVRNVFVRWSWVATQVREGQYGFLIARLSRSVNATVYVNVAVTGGTATSADYTISNTTLRFLPGQLQDLIVFTAVADLSSEGEETVELTLTPEGTLTYPIDGTAPYLVGTDPTFGDHVGLVRIIDAVTPATPEWRWTAGASYTVPETFGVLSLEISLDGPAVDNVTIHVTSANGSPAAIAGVNYVAVDTVVTIPTGQLTGLVSIVIIDDPAGVVGPDLEVDLTGVVIGGTCNDPTADTISIAIEDDDLVSSTREVQWTIESLVLTEPEAGAAPIAVTLVATVDLPFAAETDIPVTVESSGPALGLAYTIAWQPGVPVGFIRFQPQQPSASIGLTVYAEGPGVPGTVDLELQDGSTWDLGDNSTLTVTIQEAGSIEPTQLAVKRGVRTGRTIVEGMCAVNPPSATLPRYNIAGEDCQVIGHARTSEGLYDSCWVVGVAAGDIGNSAAAASYPGVGTPLELSLGAGSTPAENANFPSAAFQDIKFRLKPCNVGGRFFERALSANLAALPGSTEPQQWEGPSGALFEQVGPRLRETYYFRVWLRDTNDTEDDDSIADPNTRCCLVECWLIHRADLAVVIVEGRLANVAWDKEANAYAESPTCDGTVNFRSFDVADIPAGWDVAWATANPNEVFDGVGPPRKATLVASRATAHLLPPTAQMPFRFAMYRTSDTTSAEAQRILRDHQTFVSVGSYGVTRNGAYGECGDVQLDHGRAGYTKGWGTLRTGWGGVFDTADAKVGRYRTGWGSGAGTYDTMHARMGSAGSWSWFQSAYDRLFYATGGDGVNGASAQLPSAGYCEAARYQLMLSMMRTRLDAMDLLTGDQCWQHVLVAENGGTYAPWPAGGDDRFGVFRHPHFNTPSLNVHHIYNASTAVWCLAPTSRPWNAATPEVSADPNAADIDHESSTGYQQFDAAHISRSLGPARDAWWLGRSPLAYRQWMTLGAWISRAYSAHPVTPSPPVAFGGATYVLAETNLHYMMAAARANGSPSGTGGLYLGPSNDHWRGTNNSRRYAWAACTMSGAHAIAHASVRAGLAPVSGVNHWFRTWADWLGFVATEFGSVAQNSGSGSPVPYDPAQFGPTEGGGPRTGAFPGGIHNPITSGPWAGSWFSYGLSYMMMFKAMAVAAVTYRGLHQFPQEAAGIRKVLAFLRNQRESARAWTSAQGLPPFPICQPVTTGTNPLGATAPSNNRRLADTPPTLAEFLTGPNWWQMPDVQNNFTQKIGMCVYDYRDSGNSDHLRTFMVTRGMESSTFADAFQAIYAQWLARINGPGSADLVRLAGEESFYTTWLAEVLNLET